MTTYNVTMQTRRDTAADWTSNNPTLAAGEVGWESDTGLFKFGDGSSAWNSLSYANGGQEHIWVPAGAMVSRTTSGAEAATAELATNDVMRESMNFDTGADEFAQFSIQMPKSWNEGFLVCQAIWSHPATTTNFDVTWAIQAVALANGDANDTAFGTAVTMKDTGGSTDTIYISPESSALSVAGSPGPEELVVFQVYRDVDGAGTAGDDDLAVDARLHGIKIHWVKGSPNND